MPINDTTPQLFQATVELNQHFVQTVQDPQLLGLIEKLHFVVKGNLEMFEAQAIHIQITKVPTAPSVMTLDPSSNEAYAFLLDPPNGPSNTPDFTPPKVENDGSNTRTLYDHPFYQVPAALPLLDDWQYRKDLMRTFKDTLDLTGSQFVRRLKTTTAKFNNFIRPGFKHVDKLVDMAVQFAKVLNVEPEQLLHVSKATFDRLKAQDVNARYAPLEPKELLYFTNHWTRGGQPKDYLDVLVFVKTLEHHPAFTALCATRRYKTLCFELTEAYGLRTPDLEGKDSADVSPLIFKTAHELRRLVVAFALSINMLHAEDVLNLLNFERYCPELEC